MSRPNRSRAIARLPPVVHFRRESRRGRTPASRDPGCRPRPVKRRFADAAAREPPAISAARTGHRPLLPREGARARGRGRLRARGVPGRARGRSGVASRRATRPTSRSRASSGTRSRSTGPRSTPARARRARAASGRGPARQPRRRGAAPARTRSRRRRRRSPGGPGSGFDIPVVVNDAVLRAVAFYQFRTPRPSRPPSSGAGGTSTLMRGSSGRRGSRRTSSTSR